MQHPVATALQRIEADLNMSFLERRDAIESMILAFVAGQHWFAVGPPGTSKSLLVRTFMGVIEGARSFEIALSKTRPAEKVLGPLDIKRFRETGEYKIKRAGFATDVDLLFLDEVGKMSPVLGHDLLALLNERLYHEVNGGRSAHPAPLHTAFTASNEMPANESEDAAALWDRLLVRVVVDHLQDKRNFAQLLTGTITPPSTTVKITDVQDVTHNILPTIELSTLALEQIVKLRMDLRNEHIHPSDRRFRDSVKILQASAFLDGRDMVDDSDLAALRFTLWDTPEQIEKVHELCMSAANPFVVGLNEARAMMREIEKAMAERENRADVEKMEYGKEANQKLIAVREQLDQLLDDANGRPIPGFKAASDGHLELTRQVFKRFLGTEDDVIEVMLQKRMGKGDGGSES